MPGLIGTQVRNALQWLQKGRGQGWLHRLSGSCTAQSEPLSAEVGVGLQEYDLSLVYASAASTNNGAGGGLEGRWAGWGKQAIETNHEL